ncbi:hypothetical protein G6F68_009526 [Rhizopus microsporus]|nr:hypothetical protein G6F68_009526 [Rhizopus microsporus]
MSDYGLTEAQIIELIQRHTAQTGRDKSTEYALPSEILEDLEESSSKELRTNTQKFTKEALQYDGGKWTKSGAINKMFVQELKNAKMDAYQSIQQRFKDGDRLRVAARGATEVFEEIKFVVERGEGENDSELLEQVLEKVRRLAIYAFAAGKSIDNEAKELTARSLKLLGSVRYLDEEDEDDKGFVFSQEDVDRIQQARYEEAIVSNTRHGNRQFRNKGQEFYLGWEAQTKSNTATRPESQPTAIIQLTNPPQVACQPSSISTNDSHYVIPEDGIPPGGRLQHFISAWKSSTSHKWPISVIEQGYKIQWSSKPIPWAARNYQASEMEQKHAHEAVHKFLESGVIEKSPSQDDRFLSNLFTIQEKDKIRPILDCKRINAFIQCQHFKIEGVPALREIIETDDYITKIDLKDTTKE